MSKGRDIERAHATAKRYRETHKEQIRAKNRREDPEQKRARYLRAQARLKADPVAYARFRAKSNLGRRLNREKLQETRRRTQYGLTPEAYSRLMVEQGGLCAICHGNRKLKVDHDHRTGAVRGLLCDNCNHALGQLRDDPELFLAARDYLIRWSARQPDSPQLTLLPELG